MTNSEIVAALNKIKHLEADDWEFCHDVFVSRGGILEPPSAKLVVEHGELLAALKLFVAARTNRELHHAVSKAEDAIHQAEGTHNE